MNRGDDAGAVSDFDEAVALSGGARGGYFVQRARARARVAMRSHGREDAVAGLQVLFSVVAGLLVAGLQVLFLLCVRVLPDHPAQGNPYNTRV